MKILIIEDEPQLLNIYKEMLGFKGHELTTFSEPEKAVPHLKEEFDLIITDKKMPKMSGLEIIEKAQVSRPETPIFLITGDSTDTYEFCNIKSRIMKKPIVFDELFKYIDDLNK
jgi:DNA-binding NtrC family response regulator